MLKPLRDENPYTAPETPIRAELAEPQKKRETLREVLARIVFWGWITFMVLFGSGALISGLLLGGGGFGIGQGDLLIVTAGFITYWLPRLLRAIVRVGD